MQRHVKLTDLTLAEKAAQMIVLSYRGQAETLAYVRQGIGGIWPCGLPGDNADTFREAIRTLQEAAKIPLFISADFENGAGQVMMDGSCTEFPGLMAFGALNKSKAVKYAYAAGKVIAEEAMFLGINITPAPVADVNTEAQNPITNTRSVGDNPMIVAAVSTAYARGMMKKGRLLPQVKHFPGAGMHKQDSHYGLEQMQVTREQMENIHLLPFRKAFRAGIPMLMTNHAIYPPYDNEYPATLSYKIMTELLRNRMGFKGLAITDAMAMHGITSRYDGREALILAINAGNDLILGPVEMKKAIERIVAAVQEGAIKEATINRAVERILHYKKKLLLFRHKLDLPGIRTPRHKREALSVRIACESITLARDRKNSLPLRPPLAGKVLVLEPEHPNHPFEWGLHFNLYGIMEAIKDCAPLVETQLFGAHPDAAKIKTLLAHAQTAEVIFIGTAFRSKSGQTGLLTAGQVSLMKEINALGKTVVYIVSNPYVLAELPFADTVLVAYGNNYTSIKAAADVVFGRIKPQGRLPVQIPDFIDPAIVKILAHD
ncbi:MAG: glycoside hydrolase family 3 C-terminal domain-containing protein [Kiritimatiellaeota bacterium]|nr:glycoside hydrolase family 3 C-terminal domain-containing protein [Kiritimatiellota bacterium]